MRILRLLQDTSTEPSSALTLGNILRCFHRCACGNRRRAKAGDGTVGAAL